MFRNLLIFVTAFILVAFSSKNTTNTGAAFSIAFVSGRQLEIEPCGCSFNPIGGFEREFNLLEGWRKAGREILMLTGGVTLYPVSFEEGNEKLYREKAKYMFEGIHKMGGEILSPGSEDLYLGVEELKGLADKWDIRLISANLFSVDGKQRLFDPYVVRDIPGGKAVIIGLAAPVERKNAQRNFVVKTPDDVLTAIFAEKDLKNHLVVLVSDVSAVERARILAKFPVHIVLGGKEGDEIESVQQIRGNQLFLNPKMRGRAVARLDLDPKFPITQFFNPVSTDQFLYSRVDWRKEMAQAEKKSSAKGISKKEKQKLKGHIQHLSELVQRAETVPDVLTDQLTAFEGKVYLLDKDLDKPANSMKELFERYKKQVETSAKNGDF